MAPSLIAMKVETIRDCSLERTGSAAPSGGPGGYGGSELMILEFPMCTGHARKNRIQPFNVIDDSRVTTLLSEDGAPCSSLLA